MPEQEAAEVAALPQLRGAKTVTVAEELKEAELSADGSVEESGPSAAGSAAMQDVPSSERNLQAKAKELKDNWLIIQTELGPLQLANWERLPLGLRWRDGCEGGSMLRW